MSELVEKLGIVAVVNLDHFDAEYIEKVDLRFSKLINNKS